MDDAQEAREDRRAFLKRWFDKHVIRKADPEQDLRYVAGITWEDLKQLERELVIRIKREIRAGIVLPDLLGGEDDD